MTLEGLWHFSFTVADIDRSLVFYRDLLGLTLIHQQEQDNEYTRQLVGFPDAHLKVAMLAIPGAGATRSGHHLELVEYVAPRGVRGDIGPNNPGAAHLAFEVREIESEYQRLCAHGVRFQSSPNTITAGRNIGGITCYFRDPDDIVLELHQPPPRVVP
jgi:lactoylglutathione lyase